MENVIIFVMLMVIIALLVCMFNNIIKIKENHNNLYNYCDTLNKSLSNIYNKTIDCEKAIKTLAETMDTNNDLQNDVNNHIDVQNKLLLAKLTKIDDDYEKVINHCKSTLPKVLLDMNTVTEDFKELTNNCSVINENINKLNTFVNSNNNILIKVNNICAMVLDVLTKFKDVAVEYKQSQANNSSKKSKSKQLPQTDKQS